MKKNLLKAFTLVELIIVISIITLITSSSVFYFLDFIKNQQIKQRTKTIENNLIQLDKDVKNYKIFDYELIFDTNTQSWAYIVYLNKFDNIYTQNIDLNTYTWSWIIKTNTTSWTGIIKIFKKQKLFSSKEYNSNADFEFSFNTDPFYKIKATLSGEILNEIKINYFSNDNIKPEKNNYLNIIKINTKKDKSWILGIENLIIKNIWWNKKFYKNNINTEINSDEIYLFFENNWKEKFIKITK